MSMTISPAPPALVSRSAPAPRAESPAASAKTGGLLANQSEYITEIPDSAPAAKSTTVNVFGEFSRPRKGARAAIGDVSLKQHTFIETGYDADVCVDPTGQTLVFASDRDGDQTQLFAQRVDSSVVTQLTHVAADNAQPCFSPDGKRIAFSSNRGGQWHLYLMNADGRNLIQLTDGATNDMHPSFSPDGTRLVFSTQAVGGNDAIASAVPSDAWQLCVVDLMTRQKTPLGPGLFPVWSPQKGRDLIAFQKTRARGSRWFSLWTCELHNNESGQLEVGAVSEIAVSANAALVSPYWNPDGNQLAFVSIVEPAQTRNGKPQGQQDVWLTDADGNNRRRLTDGTAMNLTPCWAVDNRVYFVSDRSGHECIWSLSAATLEKRTPSSSAASDPSELKP